MTGQAPRARTVIARSLTLVRADRPLRAMVERFFGGCVLAFHDLCAARFRELVEALAPSTPIPLDELVTRRRDGHSTAGTFAITVDDGVRDTVRALSAVAVEKHWPITFFVPTGYLDTGRAMPFQLLDAVLASAPFAAIPLRGGAVDLSSGASRARFDERIRRLAYTRPPQEYVPVLRELVEFGGAEGWLRATDHLPPPVRWDEVAALSAHSEIRFESHGVTHTAVCALAPAELERELRESRDRIAKHTGRPARHFCYPYGGPESIGAAAPAVAARIFESAVTMSRGRVGRADRYLLPRIPLYPRDTADVARIKMLTR